MFYYERSPIPQWFRLKTDTKIQVRLACSLHLHTEVLFANGSLD